MEQMLIPFFIFARSHNEYQVSSIKYQDIHPPVTRFNLDLVRS